MLIDVILNNKLSKPKEKTEQLSVLVQEGKISGKELIAYAKTAKDPVKATCIEALEYASKTNPAVVTKDVFLFVVDALQEKAPRIKWESAKVIGNAAYLYAANLDIAITHLLINSEHIGTVVRWSAAYALGEILKLKTRHNKELIPAIEAICKREEKKSIQKIYLTVLKKIS